MLSEGNKEKSKKFSRMTIPKSEKDFQAIEEEIHSYEEHGEALEEHPHVHYYAPQESMNTVLLNAIAHTLGHIESNLSSMDRSLKEVNEKLSDIASLLSNLIKTLLINELPSKEMKKKLLVSILKELKE